MTDRSGVQPVGAAPTGLPRPGQPLEMWGGLECTINRVGTQYRDQLALSGHYERGVDDVDRLADLGITTVRWRVIAGLVHHGSGPHDTSLLDPAFPTRLADFARTVAERYPWIEAWTPVNEPLTTARFAGLYGIWYPHARHDRAFVTALAHQILATQAAMRAIRAVNPRAQLVATEDLGFTHANAALRYQAAFENERRWLTWDLLLGLVRRRHPLWNFLVRSGPVRRLFDRIADEATDVAARPALLGVNYYVTSERFLDEAIGFYPARAHGGNRWHRYADVEAVRVVREGPLGPAALLLQAWERYRMPLAITEAHIACTREQQMEWLAGMWSAAHDARRAGADVRAVTAWALFGAFDWRSLLTRNEHAYESGAWDVRAPTPRPTALVPFIQSLAGGTARAHPVLPADPWWKRPDRFEYPPRRGVVARGHDGAAQRHAAGVSTTPRPLLLVGAAGTLGHAFTRLARERGLTLVALTRADLDITNAAAVTACLDRHRPWAVINAAGWVRVDDAEAARDACRQVNVIGAEVLAAAAADRALPYCTFSSDLVFGSDRSRPFVESDVTTPANWYGHTKAEAERRVLRAHHGALVVRTSAFFGDWDDHNFVTRTLAALHRGEEALAPTDAIVSPTYVTDLGHACLDLLIDGERGLWHLANVGACSWFDLAREAAGMARLDVAPLTACRGPDIGWTAPRPAYSVLGSERATLLPSLDDALSRHVRARAWERVARHRERQPSANAVTL